MGAINYGTSDYISIGLNVSGDFDEWEQEERRNEIDAILENYGFWYFHVTLKSGYYEGFYIDIENNFPCFFDNWEEKRDAQKEVTQIRRFLMDCTAAGLVQYSPGWCTGYSTEKETRAAINATIKEMRREVQETPTYRQYNAA